MWALRKLPRAVEHIDAVARELRLHHVGLGLDHLVDAESEIRHGDLVFDVIVDAVDALVFEAGEMQNGLAHGLAGDGSGVDANAADDFALFDQHDAGGRISPPG